MTLKSALIFFAGSVFRQVQSISSRTTSQQLLFQSSSNAQGNRKRFDFTIYVTLCCCINVNVELIQSTQHYRWMLGNRRQNRMRCSRPAPCSWSFLFMTRWRHCYREKKSTRRWSVWGMLCIRPLLFYLLGFNCGLTRQATESSRWKAFTYGTHVAKIVFGMRVIGLNFSSLFIIITTEKLRVTFDYVPRVSCQKRNVSRK